MKNKVIFSLIALIILIFLGWAIYCKWYVQNNTLPAGGAGLAAQSNQPVDTGVVEVDVTKIKDPTSVFRLNLSGQNLTAVPPEVFQMTNLTLLNLSNNNITSIPADIGKLTNLQVLYLGNNDLTDLPTEIGNLKNLWLLSIFNNKITALPDTVTQIASLKTLGVKGNPLSSSTIQNLAQFKKLEVIK